MRRSRGGPNWTSRHDDSSPYHGVAHSFQCSHTISYYNYIADDPALSYPARDITVYVQFEASAEVPVQHLRVLQFVMGKLPRTTKPLTQRWLKRITLKMLGGMCPGSVEGATIAYGTSPGSLVFSTNEHVHPLAGIYVVTGHGVERPELTQFELPRLAPWNGRRLSLRFEYGPDLAQSGDVTQSVKAKISSRFGPM